MSDLIKTSVNDTTMEFAKAALSGYLSTKTVVFDKSLARPETNEIHIQNLIDDVWRVAEAFAKSAFEKNLK